MSESVELVEQVEEAEGEQEQQQEQQQEQPHPQQQQQQQQQEQLKEKPAQAEEMPVIVESTSNDDAEPEPEEQKGEQEEPCVQPEQLQAQLEVERGDLQQQEQLPEKEPESFHEVQEQPVEQEPQLQQPEDEQGKSLKITEDIMQLPEDANMSEKAIEDEEMPSLASDSSSSRVDESDTNIKEEEYSPKPVLKKLEDSDSDDSVCVIDDDDEEDEEDEEFSYDDDDEDDNGSSSYHDEREDNDRNIHYNYDNRNNTKPVRKIVNQDKDDEDEIEEDEDEEYEECYEEDGETEDDSGPDCFDGGSDDLVLRHSNGLTKHAKERSASLQDLSFSKEQSTKNRCSVNPLSQKARFERNQLEQRTPGKKFAHVQSKVKKYIMDMSEQRKLSNDRRKKAQEEARYRNEKISESQICRGEEVVMTCKTIKNYAEKTLKEVAEEQDQIYIMSQGFENGEISIFPKHSVDNGQQPIMNREEMDVDPIAIDDPKTDDRVDKINGTTVNDNENNCVNERKGILRHDEYPSKPVLNGEDPNYVSNYRTLSYDEYMKGPPNNEEIINDKMSNRDIQNIPEKCNNNDTEVPCILEIDSITSNYCVTDKIDEDEDFQNRRTPVTMVNQSTETFHQEYSEINILRSQLDQRNSQFENLRDAYQKTMSENLSMKMELENFRKTIAYYQEQQKLVPEKKVIAVQTETFDHAPSMPIIDIDDNLPIDPRIIPASMTSAASTQWLDSTGSTAISMEPPPSVTNALMSDESASTQAKRAPKQRNALSRAFLTSSKILQILSNVTTGKNKSDKYSKRSKPTSDVPKIIIDPPECSQSNNAVGPSNSRKRKASDTEEDHYSQPSKIPHTSNNERQKVNQNSDALKPQTVNANDKDTLDNTDAVTEENEKASTVHDTIDGDVKVFIYPEEEGSKEHSFLIQAKEVSSNPNREGVRECGPYLLGNVEVYMTEMNGTINIWGKELSQGSVSQNIEELETSTRSKNLKDGLRWQSTPRSLNRNVSASTSKKSRVQPRFAQHQKHHSCEMNNSVECHQCSPHHHRLSCQSCNQGAHDHQPCCPRVRVEEDCYGCRYNNERQNSGIMSGCKSHLLDGRCSLPNVYQKASGYCDNRHNHCRDALYEEPFRRQSFVRRHSFNPSDDEGESEEDRNVQQHTSKFGHSLKQNSPHSFSNEKLVPPGSARKSTGGGQSSDSLLGDNETDPLISQKQNSDEPELQNRRLSGKKVRGLLLDLFKGNCGDCKATDSAISPNLRQNASIYEPSSSVKRAAACSPNQPTCSPRSNEKCSVCRLRVDKTAEIEAQLEHFRTQMEKLNSYSVTLYEKLESLRKDDVTNK